MANSLEPSVLSYVDLKTGELAFALFLVGLVYLAVSLPAIARTTSRVLGRFGLGHAAQKPATQSDRIGQP